MHISTRNVHGSSIKTYNFGTSVNSLITRCAVKITSASTRYNLCKILIHTKAFNNNTINKYNHNTLTINDPILIVRLSGTCITNAKPRNLQIIAIMIIQ